MFLTRIISLPNEDLALLLGMQQKDLRKLCSKLRDDRLITVLALLHGSLTAFQS